MLASRKQPILSVLIFLLLAILACAVPQPASTDTAGPTATPLTTETSSPVLPTANPVATVLPTTRPTPPPPVADHRIAIHRIFGVAQFYDKATSQRFIPRGVNYFVPVPILDHYEDRLFAPGVYDHNRVEADFAALSGAGYNTVRIILDGCTSGENCIGVQDGQGLNPAYLDNIVDLMKLAQEAKLFVLFASDGIPVLGGYKTLANQDASAIYAAGRNAELLTAAGIRAAQLYWSDILGGLADRQAPFDVILAWELISEQYYISDQPPFSLHVETITPANGKTYNTFSPAQLQGLAADGIRYYVDQLRKTILTYDPTALVSMGFFAPNSPNAWHEADNRMVNTASLLSSTHLDFFDLHADPGAGLSMSELAENFGVDVHTGKPVIMGAVGASTWSYPQVSEGAIAVQDWIAASCIVGFGGWAYYGYYPSPAGIANATWGFVDGQNALLKALSPITQPDACVAGVLPGRNLALNKPVQVSESLADQTPAMAVDGDPNTQWSAGAFPTQWIQIDLGAPYTVGEMRLTVGQWPAGQVVHQVWVGASLDAMRQVYQFSGNEFDYDVLSYSPSSPLTNVRYVRIVTTESPSWVSWREIEILAPFSVTPTPLPEPSTTPTP